MTETDLRCPKCGRMLGKAKANGVIVSEFSRGKNDGVTIYSPDSNLVVKCCKRVWLFTYYPHNMEFTQQTLLTDEWVLSVSA